LEPSGRFLTKVPSELRLTCASSGREAGEAVGVHSTAE
jgi:hypothetical protein